MASYDALRPEASKLIPVNASSSSLGRATRVSAKTDFVVAGIELEAAEEEPEAPELIELSEKELEFLPPAEDDAAIDDTTGDRRPTPEEGDQTTEEDQATEELKAQEESGAAAGWPSMPPCWSAPYCCPARAWCSCSR